MPLPFKIIIGGVGCILVGCALQDFGVMPTLANALEIIGGVTIFLVVITAGGAD